MEFELHYSISNNGDGSASTHFHQTEEEAEAADGEGEGWGEPCNGSVKLKVEDGKLYFQTSKGWREVEKTK